MWEIFIENYQACFKPNANITIDADKPDTFGIKFWSVFDVTSKYLLNGFHTWARIKPEDQTLP